MDYYSENLMKSIIKISGFFMTTNPSLIYCYFHSDLTCHD
jgi:hypothetical protein